MIIEIEHIEWRSVDELPDDSKKFSQGQAVLLYLKSRGGENFVATWDSKKGKITPPVGYEFLGWAYFPKGPKVSTSGTSDPKLLALRAMRKNSNRYLTSDW